MTSRYRSAPEKGFLIFSLDAFFEVGSCSAAVRALLFCNGGQAAASA
jgi:hypothetical protein